jgi:DNA topoisomerase-3
MAEIAAMTERMVAKAKEYDRDTIPGDYATLQPPARTAAAWSRKTTAATPAPAKTRCRGRAAASRSARSPAGRTFETGRGRAVPARQARIGPLEGFRSKAGWPFTAEMVLKFDEESEELQARVRLRRRQGRARTTASWSTSARRSRWAPAPSAAARVFEHGKNYVCEHIGAHARAGHVRVATSRAARSSCSSRLSASRCSKLLATGKTDLLDKFVSMRTRRAFKAMLAWDAEAGKVNFEFAPSQIPATPRCRY